MNIKIIFQLFLVIVFFNNAYGQETAVESIKKSAENGDAIAQCYLAKMYIKGQGVSIDKKQAFYWMKKSAEQTKIINFELLKSMT